MSAIRRVKDLSDVELPAYDELPVIEAIGYRYAWDVFGRDDDLGTVNLLTPELVLAAAGLVREGRAVNLNLPLNEPDPPLFGREPIRHTLFASDRNNRDDSIDNFHPQASTQWDGLRHVRCREFGFYGGITDEFEAGAGRLGIEHWADHGIIGRGVLLDVASHLAATGREYDPFARRAITVDELLETAQVQGVEVRYGDILCVRIGWRASYNALSPQERVSYRDSKIELAGLHAGEDMARFLWDNHITALAADTPAIEMYPADPAAGSLHRRMIPLKGMAFGELFDFERLSEACREAGRFEFMFVSVPLKVPGGVGSPANAVGIL